jgi:hypothetical protein
MIASVASLLIPLALTTSQDSATSAPSLHRDVTAFVTGYNTVAGQTDSTPCIAASGADICGRRDAVACPRRISLGTTVEIRGVTYVCEDRLAKKYDSRFDISCDKDMACPYQVAGWATIKVYDTDRPQPAVAIAKAPDTVAPQRITPLVRLADNSRQQRVVATIRAFAALHPRLATAAARVFPPARPQLAVATANFIARTATHLTASAAKPVTVFRGRI